MTPSLKISQAFLDRLYKATESNLGRIFGLLFKNDLFVLGFELDLLECEDCTVLNSLPAEIDVCGILEIGSKDCNELYIETVSKNIQVTDNPVFIHYINTKPTIESYFYTNNQLKPTKYEVLSERDIYELFTYIKLSAELPLSSDFNSDSLKEAFMNIRKLVCSGSMGFRFDQTNIFLLVSNSGERSLVGISGDPKVGELIDDCNQSNEGFSRKIRKYETLNVLKINMLKRASKGNSQVATKNHAPLCIFDKKQCQTVNFVVIIDALAMVHREHNVTTLYEILVECAIRNLKLTEKKLLNDLRYSQSDELSNFIEPEIYHFYPLNCGHFITQSYLKHETEADLKPTRENLHKLLSLPINRPIFRRSNSYNFNKNAKGDILINPHVGVKLTNNDGKVSLVKGKYLYYHYCQNGIDDNGWGCAYRSLQTLASWFKLQGYIDKDVPDFKDIQKCLVDIGDKPANFIGSKQWIGSTEVSFVLESLLGVTCRILYVSSGEEMALKGPELVDHCQYNGSPIMIGGGVLAHTILGVDYNTESGSIKFLILDPHYTGNEDIHIIQNKGWCGWKGEEFWSKSSYYNMCLPQVPNIF